MIVKFCYRCKENVPMLDTESSIKMRIIHTQWVKDIKLYRKVNQCSLDIVDLDSMYGPLVNYYSKFCEDYTYTNYLCIPNHRVDNLGPDCLKYHKPLRSVGAKLCAECVHKIDNNVE